jgi:hypothetical protein
MIAPPLLKVFLAPASALWVDRLRSWIDRTSAPSTAKLVLESELNSLARSDAHVDILRRRAKRGDVAPKGARNATLIRLREMQGCTDNVQRE